MPKGLPLSYIKKWGISKKAWREFRKGTLTKGVPTRTAAIKRRLKGRNPKGGIGMARRIRRYFPRRRRRSSLTIPIAPTLGLVKGLMFPFGKSNIERAQSGDWNGIMDATLAAYTGFNLKGQFNANYLLEGTVPLIVGLLVHKVVGGTLGVNRALGRAKVPILRI